MSRALRPIDLMSTLERVNVPSAVVDRSGTVTWQNRAARETAGDLVGRPFVSIAAPEHKAVAQRQLERLLLGLPVADYAIDLSPSTDGAGASRSARVMGRRQRAVSGGVRHRGSRAAAS
jgi:PAS fold